jgi:hypothetical protein
MRVATKALFAAIGSIAAASPASAAVIIGFDAPSTIPDSNDFTTDLNGLGLTQIATSGISLVLDEDSTITFDILGSESGFDDSFSAASLTYTEFTSLLNSFAAPISIGSADFSAGDLAGLLTFTSSGGRTATLGEDGLGLFLGPDALSGDSTSVFFLGFDDQNTDQDGDFDDLIVRATVSPVLAVPEATTWAMALLGFGAAGFAMRRRRKGFAQLA